MNESIKKFLEKLEADQELQAKFAQCKNPDEAFALANSIQDGFTKEEFISEMTRIKESMEENLSEEDLAKSAGGGEIEDGIVSAAVSVCSASAVTMSATAAALAASL